MRHALKDPAWVPSGVTRSWYHFHCPPPTSSQLLGLKLDPQKVPTRPGAQKTNVANGIWPGLLCLAPVQQWGYKKPRHHLIAVSSKKETFSLHIPAEDKSLLAAWLGREQEEQRRESGEFSPSGGWVSEGSPGTSPLVTRTTLMLGIVWAPDKHKPLYPTPHPVREVLALSKEM